MFTFTSKLRSFHCAHYDQVTPIDPSATHPDLIALFKILRIMIQVEDANVQEAGGSSTFWKEARQARVFNPHLPPPQHHHHCLHPHLSQQVADEDVQARSRDEPRVPRKPTQVMMMMMMMSVMIIGTNNTKR